MPHGSLVSGKWAKNLASVAASPSPLPASWRLWALPGPSFSPFLIQSSVMKIVFKMYLFFLVGNSYGLLGTKNKWTGSFWSQEPHNESNMWRRKAPLCIVLSITSPQCDTKAPRPTLKPSTRQKPPHLPLGTRDRTLPSGCHPYSSAQGTMGGLVSESHTS